MMQAVNMYNVKKDKKRNNRPEKSSATSSQLKPRKNLQKKPYNKGSSTSFDRGSKKPFDKGSKRPFNKGSSNKGRGK